MVCTRRHSLDVLGGLGGIVFFTTMLVWGGAQAAVWHVNPNYISCPDADGPADFCTITAAINAASSGDTIYIAPGYYPEKLELLARTGNRSLTLIGSGISYTVIHSSSRGFFVQENVTIKHMTIEGVGATRSGMGGGIYVDRNVAVNLTDVVIHNLSAGVGGGIAVLAGTVNLLRAAVVNNTVQINSSNTNATQPGSGGGIFVASGATLVSTDSVISNNTANVGVMPGNAGATGGGFAAGIYNLGTTTLINTTVSGNVANAIAGPNSIPGGGITNGNSVSRAVLNLVNTTIGGNTANLDGGGVYNFNGTVNIRNSIVAGNSGNPSSPDCGMNSGNPFSSQGYNIVGSSAGCDDTVFPLALGDQKNVTAAQLALIPLPTDRISIDDSPAFLLHGLNTGSVAIDSVGTSNCLGLNNAPLNSDQRGMPRPFNGNNDTVAACDAGAYEVNEGVVVYPTELFTFEDQVISGFYVALARPPAQPVTVNVSSRDSTEGRITNNTLAFNALDWNTPKVAFIDVQNEGTVDGSQTYTIDITTTGINTQARTVTVTNIDTVTPAGIILSANSINIQEGSSPATLSVRLATPVATGTVVNIALSDDWPVGTDRQADIAPSSLRFDETNWNVAQNFNVTPRDDSVADGIARYNIRVGIGAGSTDPAYTGLATVQIPIDVLDNEPPSFAEVQFSPSENLSTTEAGGEATFSAVLLSAPSANVTINFVSNDTDEGLLLSGQTPQQSLQITFTPQNWSTPQTVTVRGVDDIYVDGPGLYSILTQIFSDDATYRAYNPPDLTATNIDNELPEITISPGSGLITDESGTSATFQVQLTAPPVPGAQVQLSANIQPPASGQPLEGILTLPSTQLVFDSTNYNQAQSVTVQGLDDCQRDGDRNYNIAVGIRTQGTTSQQFLSAAAQLQRNVSVTNRDDDSASAPQIIISKTQLRTSETGNRDSFFVCITTQPTASVAVTFDIPVGSQSEGVFNSGLVTQQINFSSANWSSFQEVIIVGRDDFLDDGDQTYRLAINPAVSADSAYSGRTAADVFITNTDNDEPSPAPTPPPSPALVITPSPQNTVITTTESGGEINLSVRLSTSISQRVNVTLTIPPGYRDEGRFRTADNSPLYELTLIFEPVSWNIHQSFTIVGVDDSFVDGDTSYAIVVGTSTSLDDQYRNLPPSNITVINQDNDRPNAPASNNSSAGGALNPLFLWLFCVYVCLRRLRGNWRDLV